MEPQQVYKIAVFQTNKDYFNYYGIPHLKLGTRVEVPFRQSSKIGIIVGLEETNDARTGLKTILTVLDDTPILTEEMLQLCRWMCLYYQTSLASVLRFALPKLYRLGKPFVEAVELIYELNSSFKMNSPRGVKQKACLEWLLNREPQTQAQLNQAGFSPSVVKSLLEKKYIISSQKKRTPQINSTNLFTPLNLNPDQTEAKEAISAKLDGYHCFLLQGVTGSGKTEVYLQIITEVLAKGKQVLVLVPEIGLTPQLRERFQSRFSQPLMVIHSQMSDGERQQAWLWAYQNQVQLILGTRSALFTPMPNLGLIIVDEEHDTSLKQMEGVRYMARDTALMRAHFNHIPIILGTATPALESLANAQKGKYTRLVLTQKALNTFPLHYQIVDLRNQSLVHGLAAPAYAAIERHLALNQQVMIFINRRGFSPVLLCHSCGWKAACPHCDACLTVHRSARQLLCHHCGYQEVQPALCPSCNGHELIFMGTGTQRLEEGLAQVFPNTSILRIDRDTIQGKQDWDNHLQQIASGSVQLIVGTQMLAKGHHFARLTLVVILDADYGFYDPDFRALERLGQLITQVSGRAGREHIAGEVLLQTHIPDHPLLNTLIQSGYDVFAQELLSARQVAQLPPFTHMALLRVQGHHLDKLLQSLHQIKQYLHSSGLYIMGPAPAPMAKKAGQHRLQLLLKSGSRQFLQSHLTELRSWIETTKLLSGLRWSLDVDPIDLN